MQLIRPNLRLIKGGRYRELIFGNTRVTISERPFGRPDGVFLEENTQLSLSGLPVSERADVAGGSVIIRHTKPTELLLIVNAGVGSEVRPGWLENAWERAFLEADRLHLQSIASPLVGCVGGAHLGEALAALAGALLLGRYANFRSLDLVCGDLAPIVYAKLRRYANPVRH
jgi:hypothetical protein